MFLQKLDVITQRLLKGEGDNGAGMLKLWKGDFMIGCLWKQHPGRPPAVLVVREQHRRPQQGAD